MKWNQHRQTQGNRHKEGEREREGGRDAQRELPEQPSCWVSLFYRLFPSDPPPPSLSLALLFLIFLVYCKQNKTQSKHTFSTQRERGGREGGREAEPTHLYVNMKSSKHTHLACSNTHSYKHTYTHTHASTPTLTHTCQRTFTLAHTHSCRRTHVGYLMLFSIQATLFAAASAAPSRVFTFSHPLKQALESPCI